MTYTEFIIGIEDNIAKANCDKLTIGEYEEEQKQMTIRLTNYLGRLDVDLLN